jgi:hypothetical protein
MLPSYGDIIRAAEGKKPLWYMDTGVPRFEPFKPSMVGIYHRYVVYYTIACQACHVEFNVTESWDERSRPCFSKELKNLHFGDPPYHGCVGDTMNCDDIEILEFWRFHSKDFEWHLDKRFTGAKLVDYDSNRE